MEIVERLTCWKAEAVAAVCAAGRDGADELNAVVWKDEYSLFGFFDYFRPKGTGLDRVFANIVLGTEILNRLQPIYELQETATAFGYFVVRRPIQATPGELIELTRQHLEKARQIDLSFSEETKVEPLLTHLLTPIPRIELVRGQLPERYKTEFDVPETTIHQMLGDWVRELKPLESDALLMHEAFYSIAADYRIAHYLMWPLYRDSTPIEEPFAPYFELWRRGARPFFERPGLLRIYHE